MMQELGGESILYASTLPCYIGENIFYLENSYGYCFSSVHDSEAAVFSLLNHVWGGYMSLIIVDFVHKNRDPV